MAIDPWEIMVRMVAEGPTLKDVVELCTEVDKLRAQLPEGMKHCTIRFIKCDKGHGRLTATNWIDNGCLQCEIAELQVFIRSEGAAGKFISWQATGGHSMTGSEMDEAIAAQLREPMSVPKPPAETGEEG